MKVYCVYIHDNELDIKKYPAIPDTNITIHGDKEYSLYGFTDNKKYAKKFMRTRRDDLFFMKVITMDKEDYKKFREKSECCEIRYGAFTKKIIDDSIIKPELELVLCTEMEYDIIMWDGLGYLNKIYDNVHQTMTYLSAKDFNYTIYNVLVNDFMYEEFLDWLSNLDMIELNLFEINTLELYFHVFGNTYNIERIDEACISGDSLRNQMS